MRRDVPTRPNFVLFITDQHRADYLGCYGHPVLRTPNIDAIAARGTRFQRFYVSSPQCMPNRATLLTGRMPSIHGVRTNGIPLPANSNTFVDLLNANGYRTALVGKAHFQNMLDHRPHRIPATLQRRANGHERHLAESIRPNAAEDYSKERATSWRYRSGSSAMRGYYGFEHVDLATLHGDMVGGDYYHWLRRHHYQADSLRGSSNSLPHDYICPQAWRTAIPPELYPTRYVEQKAVQYLRDYPSWRRDEPFFLMVSFPDPHHPFTPPGHYWDLYDPQDMPLPRSFCGAEQPTPHVQKVQAQRRTGKVNEYHAMAVTEREAREAMALTCGMVAMIDDAIGSVLDTLRERGFLDRTVVMFTSDHGDLLGDHGMLLKGPFHFDGLVRVPFIWSEADGTRKHPTCDALAGTIDISATILDRAGIEPFHGMQGRSLLGPLTGASDSHRGSFLIEEEQHPGVLDYDHALRLRTLVTQRYRMTVYQGASWGEIYDLSDDPNELRNLWDNANARQIRSELFEQLAHEQMALSDASPYPSGLA